MAELLRTESGSALVAELTQLALSAPDVPSAIGPILDALVQRTAADGSAYFQLDGNAFQARAAFGLMPDSPIMDAILAHGLPADTPLMRLLDVSSAPLFFDNTSLDPATAGFPELGVSSLAATPIRNRSGHFFGAFLMHTFQPHAWTESEAGLVASVASGVAALTARLVAEEDANSAREGAIRALGLALEMRDGETKGHTDRVTALAIKLGAEFGLDEESLHELRWGAYLHDLGKIGVPDAILRKPGKLDDSEWVLMRNHCSMGQGFAAELRFLPEHVLGLIRHHHERWDGSGYPDRLAGEAIPLHARIFSLCDVYDALVSERPYKQAWSHADAIREITRGAGTQFDPAVVDAFLDLDAKDEVNSIL